MKEVKDYNLSKDPRLIDCKIECGNGKCYAKRYGLFADKTCPNFVEPKPITNADSIRSMTDAELAKLFSQIENGARNDDQLGSDGWLDWLKEEVPTNG